METHFLNGWECMNCTMLACGAAIQETANTSFLEGIYLVSVILRVPWSMEGGCYSQTAQATGCMCVRAQSHIYAPTVLSTKHPPTLTHTCKQTEA